MSSDSVLVTGAAGFVGSHLVELLGDEAVAADADVTDSGAVEEVVRRAQPHAVVHLAALSWVAESWREPARVWEVNVVGTVNLLEAVRRERPEARVLAVSTGEVYGRAEKAAAELACSQARESGLDVVLTRAFQHEGPGRDERFAVGSWTRQLAELELAGGGALRVGNLDVERDITDVRDVCRAYRLLLEPSVPAGVYNVATGKTVRMSRVVELLVGMARCPVTVEPDPDRLRPADIPVLSGDPSRLEQATGWRPEIPLERTLADTLEAARQLRVGV
jgi:GDP-4-dehydro-6-deoxy-D-mannose reductase